MWACSGLDGAFHALTPPCKLVSEGFTPFEAHKSWRALGLQWEFQFTRPPYSVPRQHVAKWFADVNMPHAAPGPSHLPVPPSNMHDAF